MISWDFNISSFINTAVISTEAQRNGEIFEPVITKFKDFSTTVEMTSRR
mgnify:CR=1 FL=1